EDASGSKQKTPRSKDAGSRCAADDVGGQVGEVGQQARPDSMAVNQAPDNSMPGRLQYPQNPWTGYQSLYPNPRYWVHPAQGGKYPYSYPPHVQAQEAYYPHPAYLAQSIPSQNPYWPGWYTAQPPPQSSRSHPVSPPSTTSPTTSSSVEPRKLDRIPAKQTPPPGQQQSAQEAAKQPKRPYSHEDTQAAKSKGVPEAKPEAKRLKSLSTAISEWNPSSHSQSEMKAPIHPILQPQNQSAPSDSRPPSSQPAAAVAAESTYRWKDSTTQPYTLPPPTLPPIHTLTTAHTTTTPRRQTSPSTPSINSMLSSSPIAIPMPMPVPLQNSYSAAPFPSYPTLRASILNEEDRS
ncbi:hypothetical protein HDU97_008948, partial [Phlyctochytrium planicorne]